MREEAGWIPEWGEGEAVGTRTDSKALNQDRLGVQGAAEASGAATATGQSERPLEQTGGGGEESRAGEAGLVRLR